MSKLKETVAVLDAGEPLLEQSEKVGTLISSNDDSRRKLQSTGVKRNKSKQFNFYFHYITMRTISNIL